MNKLRKRRKRKLLKFIIVILMLIVSFNIYKNRTIYGENTNPKYKGIGQKQVKNKDGYATIFITDEENKKEYIEYKQGKGASWKDNSYWGGTMEENGCGITSLSIIASGYGSSVTPEDLRQKYEPHLEGEDIPKELRNTFNIECTDFIFSSALYNKKKVIEHLETNRPILICVWNKPDKRWTEKSHYMVLLATDGEDKVYVSNPNGYEKETFSGWYRASDVLPYVAKALFIESF